MTLIWKPLLIDLPKSLTFSVPLLERIWQLAPVCRDVDYVGAGFKVALVSHRPTRLHVPVDVTCESVIIIFLI